MSSLLWIASYTALLWVCLLYLPIDLMSPTTFFALGFIGVWRYGWHMLTFARALYYHHRQYPRLSAALQNTSLPPINIILCSYQTPWPTSTRVLTSLAQAISAYPRPVTLFIAATDRQESAAMQDVLREVRLPETTKVFFYAQYGRGKRAALAEGIRRVTHNEVSADSVTFLMDGDSVIPPDILSRCARHLHHGADGVDALTVNNQVRCHDAPLLGYWLRLRLAQRHVLMGAQSVSARVLVLTGRFSAYRTQYLRHPDVIRHLEDHAPYHWHYGRVPLLTGDDKSLWLFGLQQGWRMRYLPDVSITNLEHPPFPTFWRSTLRLQQRWYGNSLRANDEALRLGWQRMPFYTWWSVLDQRVSMWTSLLAPMLFAFEAFIIEPSVLAVYGVWVLCTRSLYTLALYSFYGSAHPSFVLFLFYNQVVGNMVKIYCFFHRYQQRWTRHQTHALPATLPQIVLFAHLWQGSIVTLFCCALLWMAY